MVELNDEKNKWLVYVVFHELLKLKYDELNKILGNLTIDEMQHLHSELRHEEYCERHHITYDEMTDDDFEDAYLEEVDEYLRREQEMIDYGY